MTEANNNFNSFNSELNLEPLEAASNHQGDRKEVSAADDNLGLNNISGQVISPTNNITQTEQDRSPEQKMNWQKVAHKLREYNRKLLKKVFRLEQELADVDNKFSKYIEKSRSNDVLVANQEKELKKHQEQVESFERQLSILKAAIDSKETDIANLSQQYKLSQQQTAQLERDCTLLQENYNHQTYELITKEQDIKELQEKLSQQQRSALQYKAELKRYQEQQTASSVVSKKEPVIPPRQNYSHQRSIQPWSTVPNSETTIALPKTKSRSLAAPKNTPSQTVKTAAQIATWSAPKANEQPKTRSNNTAQPKSSVKVKPQSLAAVDLPTFPRPM